MPYVHVSNQTKWLRFSTARLHFCSSWSIKTCFDHIRHRLNPAHSFLLPRHLSHPQCVHSFFRNVYIVPIDHTSIDHLMQPQWLTGVESRSTRRTNDHGHNATLAKNHSNSVFHATHEKHVTQRQYRHRRQMWRCDAGHREAIDPLVLPTQPDMLKLTKYARKSIENLWDVVECLFSVLVSVKKDKLRKKEGDILYLLTLNARHTRNTRSNKRRQERVRMVTNGLFTSRGKFIVIFLKLRNYQPPNWASVFCASLLYRNWYLET